MTKELFYYSDVSTGFYEVCCKAVPEEMAMDAPGYSCFFCGFFQD